MPEYVEKLRADLVEQFKEKPVIDALSEAIGKQLNDVFNYFLDLQNLRGVQTAVGKQLDGVGDIVVLSRKEAGELACINESVFVIDDEEYRKYLIYKIWKNTCTCTYANIINAFRMFWDKPLYYSESPDIPATMIFETSELTPQDNAAMLLTAPFIKAAGVAIKVIAYTVTPEMRNYLLTSAVGGHGYSSTTLPEFGADIDYTDTAEVIPAGQNVTQTNLPNMEDI